MNEEEQKKFEMLEKENKNLRDAVNKKPSKISKFFWWLTFWRPVTKLEYAKMAQTVVSNRTRINSLIQQHNILVLRIQELQGYVAGKEVNKKTQSSNKKNNDNKDNKSDVMYR